MTPDDLERVYRYHDGTKHHFNRFARALGYLDWASQPRPFRSFDGAPSLCFLDVADAVALAPPAASSDGGPGSVPIPEEVVSYDRLLTTPPLAPHPIDRETIGHFLRYALGLSAWKVFRESRWSLRVNPSSGNLHPTEAYLIAGDLGASNAGNGLETGSEQSGGAGTVWHYAPDRHAIERRCLFAPEAWDALAVGEPADGFLVALTSIHWRESWKYGERAFRYCQHDLGHAVAALGLSAAVLGWRTAMLPSWSHRAVAGIAGIDRDEDYFDAEREEPACLILVSSVAPVRLPGEAGAFTAAVRDGRWSGRASQLSEDHVEWTFIDEVARATTDPGGAKPPAGLPAKPARAPQVTGLPADDRHLDARALILQRRSALALDGASSIDRDGFLRMLSRLMPWASAPWDAVWWTPRIHLALFVHRVDGLTSGLYLLPRSAAAVPALRAALSGAFLWEPVADSPPLFLLEPGDYRARAMRVSCDQTIAADGFFSLGMLAEFDGSLRDQGPALYRHLFWESGVVGQVLYLEAEAAGARGTGIGCFYDDAVHELLGLRDHAFQSLYHFTVGAAVDDSRLTTEAAY